MNTSATVSNPSITILNKIVETKRREVALARTSVSDSEIQRLAHKNNFPVRNFYGEIYRSVKSQKAAVIAEIKHASPSKGILRDPFDVAKIAYSYLRGGATCLSVLTDVDFFKGKLEYLEVARNAVDLPILRKDFTIDVYQIYEARAYGADAILLIAMCLSDFEMREYVSVAHSLNMTVLIEVHDAAECERVLPLFEKDTPVLLGINNRNLATFVTALETTFELLARIPKDTLVISESGISSSGDIQKLQQHGVWSYLIGETFMRALDPGKALSELISTRI